MKNVFLFLGFVMGILLVLVAFFAPVISPLLAEDKARSGLGFFGGIICVGAALAWMEEK